MYGRCRSHHRPDWSGYLNILHNSGHNQSNFVTVDHLSKFLRLNWNCFSKSSYALATIRVASTCPHSCTLAGWDSNQRSPCLGPSFKCTNSRVAKIFASSVSSPTYLIVSVCIRQTQGPKQCLNPVRQQCSATVRKRGRHAASDESVKTPHLPPARAAITRPVSHPPRRVSG